MFLLFFHTAITPVCILLNRLIFTIHFHVRHTAILIARSFSQNDGYVRFRKDRSIHHLKPRILFDEQVFSNLRIALAGIIKSFHRNIHQFQCSIRFDAYLPRLRDTNIIDQNLGSVFQRGSQSLQDLDAVLVRPVVQDPAVQIQICALDGLWREEIVRHFLDPAFEICGNVGGQGGNDVGLVLDNELQVRIRVCTGDGGGDLAFGAAYVHDGCATGGFGERVEGIVMNEVGDVV